jgi:hypothetical protein
MRSSQVGCCTVNKLVLSAGKVVRPKVGGAPTASIGELFRHGGSIQPKIFSLNRSPFVQFIDIKAGQSSVAKLYFVSH